jgi:nucleoside-diphosphate-sugar epimerase
MAEQTFLVTGALGCIGAWTLKHLVQAGERAVAFDISTDRQRLDLLLSPQEQAQIQFEQGDLTDREQVAAAFQAYRVTHVVHLGALQVPFCKADPVRGAQVNVTGTVNVFEGARAAGVPHVAYASSIAVYGPPEAYPPGPLAPDAPPAPGTLYGVYKVANEGTARIYWDDQRISSTGLRPYTVYGVGRDQGLTSDPTKAMLAAVRGEPFEIGFGGSMQFQLASDVARLFIQAARRPAAGASVFNLDTPSASVGDVIDIILTIRPQAQITYKEIRLPFPELIQPGGLGEHLQAAGETALETGIRRTMAHFEKLEAGG